MTFKILRTGVLAFTAALMMQSTARAQTAPPGAIFDMATVHPGAFNPSSYTQFSTTFVATAASEYVSFAFREAPSYFALDDVSVIQAGGATNLLADPGFESDTAANVNTNFPVGWSRWIQPVDTSAIGVVAGPGNNYGCSASGPRTGAYFWCDGSVEGYDAIYQQVNGLTIGATYNVTFWVTDESGAAMTVPSIDMLVYAGTALPVGSQPLGATPSSTPAPRSLWLALLGIAGLATYWKFRTRNA